MKFSETLFKKFWKFDVIWVQQLVKVVCYCVGKKHIMLCNCLRSSSCSCCCFSTSRVRDFGIVNWYSWCWKPYNIADWRGEFNLFQDAHVRIDKRINISVFIGPMTTKFGKQVHLDSNETNQAGVSDVITSRSREKLKPLYLYQNAYNQTWQDGNWPWGAPTLKITRPFDHVVWRDHVTN